MLTDYSRSDSSPHNPQGVFPGFHLARQFCLLVFFAGAACANVCTPLTAPANGPFPAIPANGIDGVSWSVARVEWTSDASSGVPATRQQISYATAAEWASAPNVYPHLTAQQTQTVTASTTIESGILSNLLPNTLYHVLAQSYQGGAWCSANDQTFTTAARPAGVIKPQLPLQVDTTRPAMNGTHWIYGSNCGTTAGSTATIVNANLQDCLDKMNAATGDDLGLPPGAYPISQVNFHNSENSVNVTCSTTNSTCTQSGTAPPNGSKVIFGNQTYGTVPSPINPGIPYKIVNSTGSTFQVSYDGVTPLTLLNTGSTVGYVPWPLTQPKMVIHSTAAANLLPPPGVRLGPDALAQYYPYMPNLQAVDPIRGATSQSYLTLAPLTENLTFENLRFSVDPAVATSTNPTDPVAFKFPISLALSNTGITYDQVAFDPGPTPTRTVGVLMEGVNNAVVNSYALIDFWQPHYYVPSNTLWSVTSNTISLPPSTWSYVGPSGTKVSCPSAGGTITISGSVSGNIALWVDANCTWEAQLTNGLSAASSVPGMVISHAATPAYPTYTYTSPLGATLTTYAAIPFYILTVSGGSIVNDIYGNFFDPGHSSQALEGSIGFNMDAYGPLKFDNNYIKGSAITGIFWAEGLTLGTTVCGYVNPCPIQAVIGNLTATRNTITTDPDKFFYDSPDWDGGNRYWRNTNENKAGRFSYYDGNIIGPWSAQVGEGQCALHEEFETSFVQIGNLPPYQDSSDWTFTNNTCLNTPSGLYTSYSFVGFISYPYPIRNFLVQNNLFLNDNPYSLVAHNQPFRSNGHVGPDQTSIACGVGTLLSWVPGESFLFDHNTVSGMGGCQPFLVYYNLDFNSGGFTNNILNLVNDPGPFAGPVAPGTYFNNQGYLGGACVGATGTTIFNCINNFQWAGNVMLATWKNSYPGSQVDFASSDIATAQSYFPSSGANWPNANTLALRQAQIGWFNVAAADFRLKSSSPYISGNQRSAASPTNDSLDAGANMDQLLAHQGHVNNVRVLSATSTSLTLGFYAPDSFACGFDYGSTAFYNGSGSWNRIAGSAGSPDPRVQSVAITGLLAHSLVYYRLNCAVQQPTGTVQLP